MIREYKNEDFESVKSVYENGRKAELLTAGIENIISLDKDEKKYKNFKIAKNFVYELNGEIVGFVSINEKDIALLFVHEKARGYGIGKKLMLKGMEIAGDKATLDVLEENNLAKTLYYSLGFIEKSKFTRLIDGKNPVILHLERK